MLRLHELYIDRLGGRLGEGYTGGIVAWLSGGGVGGGTGNILSDTAHGYWLLRLLLYSL